MFVLIIVDALVALAEGVACGLNLKYIPALCHSLSRHMVRTLRHSIVITKFVVSKITPSHNALIFKPSPRRTNLTPVAAIRLTILGPATTGGIGHRKQLFEVTLRRDTKTVVEGFCRTMSPTGAAV